ncbi:MAG: hypothetical protein ACI9J3_001463 [Parvicellaceae bacterium]|jgi:hypothetical protein
MEVRILLIISFVLFGYIVNAQHDTLNTDPSINHTCYHSYVGAASTSWHYMVSEVDTTIDGDNSLIISDSLSSSYRGELKKMIVYAFGFIRMKMIRLLLLVISIYQLVILLCFTIMDWHAVFTNLFGFFSWQGKKLISRINEFRRNYMLKNYGIIQ